MSFFPSSTITLDAALRDLASTSVKARTAAAHALGDAAGDDRPRAIAALIRALDDDHAVVRAEAASSLGEIGDDDAVEPLARRLTEGDPQVRQNAAIALGSLGKPAGFAPLLEALRSGPPDVRFQAATSLPEIDPAAAYQPLVAALDDSDPIVIASIALSLGAIGDGRATAHLAPLVEHRDAAVRFDASYALAELRDPRGRAVLAAGLDDGNRAWDAAAALEWLGTDADAAALAGLLGKRKAEPNAVIRAAGAILRIAAATAVDAPHVAAARRVLLDALTHRKLPPRGLAIQELATAGGDWALAPLERMRTSRKGKGVTDEIADTLRQIKERAS